MLDFGFPVSIPLPSMLDFEPEFLLPEFDIPAYVPVPYMLEFGIPAFVPVPSMLEVDIPAKAEKNHQKKNKDNCPGPDGEDLSKREVDAEKGAKALKIDVDAINEKDFVKLYMKVPENNRKAVRIFLAKIFFPVVDTMSKEEKLIAAKNIKYAFKQAISELGYNEHPRQEILSVLMKAVGDRLQVVKKRTRRMN